MEISMKTPHSVDFASLIRTYYAIDSRAKRLTELLIVFSRVFSPFKSLCLKVRWQIYAESCQPLWCVLW